MRAAVLVETKGRVELMDLKYPSLLEGQVLVKVAYTGVCQSQLMEVSGNRGEDKWLPHLLGHEATGKVIEVGAGVTKVKAGDDVILGWIKGAGKEAPGAVYQVTDDSANLAVGAKVNSGGVTTFSDFTVVSENRCTLLPAGIPLNVGVLFGCALPTGAGIVLNEIKPQAGQSIAVIGLGGVGLSALLMAKALGCSPIVAFDVEESKLKLAKELGADFTYKLPEALSGERERELSGEVMKELQARAGFDFVVEASGQVRCIEFGFSLLRPQGGLCVFASHPKAGEKIQLDPYAMIQGRRIQGSWGGASSPDRDIPLMAKMYREGKLPLEKLLSRPYAFEEINQALEDLRLRKISRAIVQCSEEM